MSAICGVVSPEPTNSIAAMMAAMAAYGRDGAHVWHGDGAALGHQALHLTPESRTEELPYFEPDAALAITADARLDNRDDLLAVFDVPAGERASVPDSVLILAAYERWGEECPRHLLGDFAFAVWDARRRAVFCARDPVGARPLFYHAAPSRFALASDVRGVLACPGVPDGYDETFLASYLSHAHFDRREATFFAAIRKLAPAHALLWRDGDPRVWRYWSPEDAPALRLRSDAEYAERLRALLQEAVRCRLRSAYPVGSHLSGGLDSSSIAVFAARELRARGETLHAFSWSAPAAEGEAPKPDDERPRVARVCAQEGIPCEFLRLTHRDRIRDASRDHSVEPTVMILHEERVQELAAARGIRLLLSGWGGDEFVTFNGRGLYAQWFRTLRWGRLLRELFLISLHGRSVPTSILQRWLLGPLLPKVGGRPIGGDRLPGTSYLHPDMPRPGPEIEGYIRPDARANMRFLLDLGHLNARMESWAASGAERGITYAYPLLDRRLVEFAFAIPVEMFHRRGFSRYVARLALDGVLPPGLPWGTTKVDPGISRPGRPQEGDALPIHATLDRLRAMAADGKSRYIDVDRLLADLESGNRKTAGVLRSRAVDVALLGRGRT